MSDSVLRVKLCELAAEWLGRDAGSDDERKMLAGLAGELLLAIDSDDPDDFYAWCGELDGYEPKLADWLLWTDNKATQLTSDDIRAFHNNRWLPISENSNPGIIAYWRPPQPPPVPEVPS